jgi:hypothetical protein
LNGSFLQQQHQPIVMSRTAYPASGPERDDVETLVDYEEGEPLREIGADDESDDDLEQRARRRGWKDAPASSQQLNSVKQSASNARAAASAAASNASSSAENAGESNDLRLITLIRRYERKLGELSKREREVDDREKSSSSKSSKRRKSSSSKRSSSTSGGSSDSEVSSDDSDGNGGGSSRGRRHSSSSNGLKGKDITLRQDVIMNKFPTLSYVDISVFSRANLNVRKSKRLVPISSSAEYSAAWASFNVEMQQYLINANRSDDALMVSKYYSQIVRLLTDYSSQWKLAMELDGYIRGNPSIVEGRVVWSIDREDDNVSQYRYDMRFNHRDTLRAAAAASGQRGAVNQVRRSGAASNVSSSSKPRNVCYAYNGLDSSTGLWTDRTHCRGAERCKFAHRCLHCKLEGHAVYERAECASQPRVLPAPPRPAGRR